MRQVIRRFLKHLDAEKNETLASKAPIGVAILESLPLRAPQMIVASEKPCRG